MLVLLSGPRSGDKRHIPSGPLTGEFERKEVRDLKALAVTAAGKYIVAEKHIG